MFLEVHLKVAGTWSLLAVHSDTNVLQFSWDQERKYWGKNSSRIRLSINKRIIGHLLQFSSITPPLCPVLSNLIDKGFYQSFARVSTSLNWRCWTFNVDLRIFFEFVLMCLCAGCLSTNKIVDRLILPTTNVVCGFIALTWKESLNWVCVFAFHSSLIFVTEEID